MILISAFISLLALGDLAAGAQLRKGPLVGPPRTTRQDTRLASAGELTRRAVQVNHFDQLVDHGNPSLGTFKQRYWWDTTYYGGPGHPIVVYNAGEFNGEYATTNTYVHNRSIPGMVAAEVGGAVVIIEHRYFGESNPFSQYTVANLSHLNLNNSIADMVNFARTAKLPFANGNASATDPSRVPWINVGSSYSGSLADWTQRLDATRTFWATYVSSSKVQLFDDFWMYFKPVELGMPKNCSADINRVIDHVDKILQTGSAKDKLDLKTKFGWAKLKYDDDFAEALSQGPYLWQSKDFSFGYMPFDLFCDYVENAVPSVFPDATAPGPDGVGLEKALDGYAKWMQFEYITKTCQSTPNSDNAASCADTHDANASFYTSVDVDPSATDRQWQWMNCVWPLAGRLSGAPKGEPTTLKSRLVTPAYWARQCASYFPAPAGSKLPGALTPAEANEETKGGYTYAGQQRVLYVNNQFDPWLYGSVSSPMRPGGPMQTTGDKTPVLVIPGGDHMSDFWKDNAEVNAEVEKLQNQAIDIMVKWIKEFPGKK
ncbi:hypothetical protein MCOR21_001292 [Pyricularia oryzae]|uniref:Uncharacterized protein n=1 Tax=Pyricularia grisea TaxID=148305 RepID=A0ABQ8NYA9_PYRGI|nr:hypothetical protein MCOR26_002646 [Pyricularia oryzae]KAI6303390.1 hypothetical protein MCOR33_001479 [Pyricularia grisea]KAI6347324.1 hypothetical protein MCOR28_002374 [Pyricularia oryzae]KAI6364372.1 hypothetical protein MCOR32_007930 [Pyricularia oryzae]KAI6436182.1 hypothetical protein MCOR21_001292 [Pyricularia oryzae]